MKIKILLFLLIVFFYPVSNLYAGLFPTGEVYKSNIKTEKKHVLYGSFLGKITLFPFTVLPTSYHKNGYIYSNTINNSDSILKMSDFSIYEQFLIIINTLLRIIIITFPFILFLLISKKAKHKLIKELLLPVIALGTLPWIFYFIIMV